MVIDDLKRFDELAECCGNKYLAIQYISQWARAFGNDCKDYSISESKLIQWVVQGRCPYSRTQMFSRKRTNQLDNIDDILEWVEDEEVVNEVRYLYKESIRNKKLTYCTNSRFKHGRKSRVNILLRMAWFSV